MEEEALKNEATPSLLVLIAEKVEGLLDLHPETIAERLAFSVREALSEPHPRTSAPFTGSLSVYFWKAIDILSIFLISRFTRYPLRLCGGVGSVFAAFGFAILLVVDVQRRVGEPLAHRRVLVLETLLVGLGVQAFTIGLLSELLLFSHAQHSRLPDCCRIRGGAASAACSFRRFGFFSRVTCGFVRRP
jgi:hypothetical protein